MPNLATRDQVATEGGCIIVDKRLALSQAPASDMQTLARCAQCFARVRTYGRVLARRGIGTGFALPCPDEWPNNTHRRRVRAQNKTCRLGHPALSLGNRDHRRALGARSGVPSDSRDDRAGHRRGRLSLLCFLGSSVLQTNRPVSRDDEEGLQRDAAIRAARPVPSVSGAAMSPPSLPVSPR